MQNNIDSISFLQKKVMDHVDERNWKPTERGLAISITIEAAELLEHFQWENYALREDQDATAEELADVLIYALQFAHLRGIAIGEVVLAKLEKSAKRYPVNLDAQGYYRVKQARRQHESSHQEA